MTPDPTRPPLRRPGRSDARRERPPPGPYGLVPQPGVRPLVTLAVVAFSGLLVLSVLAGVPFVAAAVALGGGVLAWGWAGLLGLPSPRGTTSVLAFGTAAAVLTGALTRTDPFLRWMPAALALSMLVAFLHQLLRRDGRPRLVESVVSVVTGLAVVVSGACLVPLALTADGGSVMAVAGAALGVAALVDLLARRVRLRPWLVPMALVAGTARRGRCRGGVRQREPPGGRAPRPALRRGELDPARCPRPAAGDERPAQPARLRLGLGARLRRRRLRRGPAPRRLSQ